MEALAKKLPAGIGYEWTGISLQQQVSGSQAPLLYALSILVVFLSLAALYESWSIPISVIMVVPDRRAWRARCGHLIRHVERRVLPGGPAHHHRPVGEERDPDRRVRARELQAEGRSALEAAVEAAHMRMRPIVMTSMAFGLGVLPLALANGAGSASQNAIGTGVIGGMLTATFLATFLIPMFFVVISDKLKAQDRSPCHAGTRPPTRS